MRFQYPSDLPISAAHDQIVDAVRSSQAIIVSGQTGSGKTTQIPKILLEIGRAGHGKQIVHTQPRRLAARTVAERIASEMGVKLGDEIGFQVRFSDRTSPGTRLRVVTDGVLLAQIQHDPQLNQYDTIVIDEAHERTLNIDFLLGYLTSLLPRRRDLKLIITSATIDSVKFKDHFEQALHSHVPVIEVSGRTYPVQVVYEPPGSPPALMNHVPGFPDFREDPAEAGKPSSGFDDVPHSVARACAELVLHSSHQRGPRDILLFASGERDIHEFESAIRRHFGPRAADMSRSDAIEIVPLFARLSSASQHRVFEAHSHQRIIIATNVAETSLTVPGIRYVVDPGTARISRYCKTAKVQRLPIEPISQASADQRAGRCGRVADGIAIRLYSLDDYESHPPFTEPEILRTSLGAVVLHMLSVGVAHTIKDVTDFGFIDPPDVKSVSDGFNELTELRAISRKHGNIFLTAIGRQLSRIPIDIRLGRMLIEAAHTTTPNTLASVVVVVAFLSLQDPRERPDESREEADRIHNRFADSASDFLTALNLWDYAFPPDKARGNSALRKICNSEYLNFMRLRQWRDLVSQLTDTCKELKFKIGKPRPISMPDDTVVTLPINQQAAHSLCRTWDVQGIHQSMLAGLLSQIGMQVVSEPKASEFTGFKGAAKARAMKRAQKMSKNDYRGAHNTRFALFPASTVAKTTPPWVMAAELVETSRLWSRYSAAIDPAWAEPLAGQLTRVTYAEPHWSRSRGSAVAQATVLLYGLPIVQNRMVQWGRINPMEARDFLIRQGLVQGDIQQRFPYDQFIEDNRTVLEQAMSDTNRTRALTNAVGEEDLFDFYHATLPTDVTNMVDLAKWVNDQHESRPQILAFDPSQVERLQETGSISLDDYPDHWHTMGSDGRAIDLRLSYIYDPSDPADGVSLHVPLKALSQLAPEQFSWNVPGLLDDLILAMIKALPKTLRVQFVPAPDTARKIRIYIDDHYPDLPGSGSMNHPNLPPVDEENGEMNWPDFVQVFITAAIAVSGAQIHPGVFDRKRMDSLAPYLRMTFLVEDDQSKDIPGGKSSVKKHNRKTVKLLGSGKSLSSLQSRFALKATASARKQVEAQAKKAAAQGRLVEETNLLHKAGASKEPRVGMLWRGALERLRLPAERISSRWLGSEALMLASAPYRSIRDLVEDVQMAAVERLLPNIDQLESDQALDQAVTDVEQIFEDTAYQVARDVVIIMKRYAQVEQAVSGPADLPMLSVLQAIRKHASLLVRQGFVAATPTDALPNLDRYLHADMLRLTKAKNDKDRDVRWAWQADEAKQIVDKACGQAQELASGPRREQALKKVSKARWMLEEFYVSLWAQELGTAQPASLQRIRKTLD